MTSITLGKSGDTLTVRECHEHEGYVFVEYDSDDVRFNTAFCVLPHEADAVAAAIRVVVGRVRRAEEARAA